MTYLVEFAARAVRDLEMLYLEKNAAADWYNRLEEAVYTLAPYSYRGPMAPEARKTKRKLQSLLYGRKPHIYRVICEVDEGRQAVRILTIRHGARRRFEVSGPA